MDMASYRGNTVAASAHQVCIVVDPFCIEHNSALKCVSKLSEISTKVITAITSKDEHGLYHCVQTIGYVKWLFIWQCGLCTVLLFAKCLYQVHR